MNLIENLADFAINNDCKIRFIHKKFTIHFNAFAMETSLNFQIVCEKNNSDMKNNLIIYYSLLDIVEQYYKINTTSFQFIGKGIQYQILDKKNILANDDILIILIDFIVSDEALIELNTEYNNIASEINQNITNNERINKMRQLTDLTEYKIQYINNIVNNIRIKYPGKFDIGQYEFTITS